MYLLKKRFFQRLFIIVLSIIAMAYVTSAQELTVSMAHLPNILESPDKGVFIDIIKAIDDEYAGIIKREVFPFARSIDNVITEKADFHLPMIRNKIVKEENLPYAYTTEKMGDVFFVIYSNTQKPLTLEDIKKTKNTEPFPYNIESMGGFLDYFDFPIKESFGVDNSLKKVNAGRIDAFIFAQEECDFTLKQLKLKNVHREKYDSFDDVFVLPKREKGKKTDKILSECLKKLKASGKLEELYKKVHLPYQTWQPSKMGW